MQPMDEVDVSFDILGKGNVEYLILSETVLRGPESVGIEVQQVSARLKVRLQRRMTVVIGIAKACLHDKQVFVIVAQDYVRI